MRDKNVCESIQAIDGLTIDTLIATVQVLLVSVEGLKDRIEKLENKVPPYLR